MKLTEKDIETLHYHINAKLIPYTEVRDEVLDHYQTALEQEEERSMKEVLAELDQTFTFGYCRNMAGRYLQNLRHEYPLRFKKELFTLFTTKRIWIPISVLGFVLTFPNWIPNIAVLVHLLNGMMLSILGIENWMISRQYPNKKQKHHYRSIDDKPIFAHSKADSPRGFAILHTLCTVIVIVPLLFVFIMEMDHETGTTVLFKPPFLYATLVGLWFFITLTIVRYRAKTNLTKPQFA
jgi:hypothetical protein